MGAEVWADVFPDDFVVWRHFQQAAVFPFGDEGVAVWQALGAGNVAAVEVVGDEWLHVAEVHWAALPHDLHGHWVELDHAGVVAMGVVVAGWSCRVWRAVASPAAVVKDEDVASARQALRNHVGMMLADDLADLFGFAGAVVRTEFPDEFVGLFVENGDDVGGAAVKDDVVRMETFVAGVVPFVWPQHAHAVDVHPVAKAVGHQVWIAGDGVFGGFVKAQLVEMVMNAPIPDDVAVPVDLNHAVADEFVQGNLRHNHVGVRENQGVAAVDFGVHAWHVVADWVAFALVIVVLARHPLWLVARIFDVLVLLKFPAHLAVPVHLHNVLVILPAIGAVALAAAAKDVAVWQELVWKAFEVVPVIDHAAVHINERRAVFIGLEQGVAVEAFVRFVDDGACWVNGWGSHNDSSFKMVRAAGNDLSIL